MENNKKKILIHSLIFSPDGVSTAYLCESAVGFLIQKLKINKCK